MKRQQHLLLLLLAFVAQSLLAAGCVNTAKGVQQD